MAILLLIVSPSGRGKALVGKFCYAGHCHFVSDIHKLVPEPGPVLISAIETSYLELGSFCR